MFIFTPLLKKIVLAVLILMIGLVALPAASASAAGIYDETTPPSRETDPTGRLEQAWERLQQAYTNQGVRLGKASEFISGAQALIDMANARGYDTSAVQAALDAFSAFIPAAQAVHETGAAIIASHPGFDDGEKVTDHATAIQTDKTLGHVIKETHTAMGGTGEALREAIRAFREAHRPSPAEIPSIP